ncbi:hypothetical protein [Desulfobacula sp.]|uniref:hypothetical protein n=1 Tax=Desulfobacula sp. TaxID=2593537 RepID=UPI002714B43F|nr:hypothetical protein [Desulfobacula sp.]
MTFWESALSASIGAFIGFIGALIIFFIKEIWQQKIRTTSTVKNLKMELAYNINLYEKCEKSVQECIEAISNGSRSLYLKLDYNFVGVFFATQFYQSGLLLKYFHPEDMRRWNVMLNQIGAGADAHVANCVKQWREEEDIKQETVYNALKHEKSQISYAKEMSEYILAKLPLKGVEINL